MRGKRNKAHTSPTSNKNTTETIDAITTRAFKGPKWTHYLMKIRNLAVGMFGLKTGDDKRYTSDFYPIGSRAVHFTVIDRNDSEIVMGENDKHLNFRTSVLINRKSSNPEIYVTTLVRFNNIWGKIYFLPVKPFHKMIIKSLLKNL